MSGTFYFDNGNGTQTTGTWWFASVWKNHGDAVKNSEDAKSDAGKPAVSK